MNLVPAIREMESSIYKMKTKHANELKELEDGLIALRKLNTACEKCGGYGKVDHRATAECDVEEITCSKCSGSGKAKY